MSRLNVNSVNPHDGVKVSITGSTNGGLIVSASPASDANPVVQVHGSVSASGELTASNAFFSGNVHAVGNIYVEGHATFSAFTPGGIQLGDQNTDNVTFGADVNSNIIPDVNNTYDLGSDAQEWRDIYVEGTGYIDRLVQDDASVTNTARGDWNFNDDAGVISLRVNSADGNIGVKVSDPNTEFEVSGSISASGDIAIEGNITGSNISASAKLSAEHLYISDDAEIVDLLTVGQILVTNVTASNISASGTITANKIESDQLFSHVGDANTGIQLGSDTVQIEGNDVILANFTTARIELNKPVTASVNISSSETVTAQNVVVSGGMLSGSSLVATHSLGGELHIADQVSIMDGGGQGRIGIGTLTPDATHRLHIQVHNSAAQSLLKFQTNAGTATHGLFATGNHYIHSTKTGGALELGAAGSTMMHLSSSGKVITDSTISASLATATHSFGGEIHVANQVSIMDGGGQGRIGIGTLTPDPTHRLHIQVANSAAQPLLKFQTNGGTATHGIRSGADGGNHYIHSTKTGGALELGAAGSTMIHVSSSGKIITGTSSVISASNASATHTFGGVITTPITEDLADSGAASLTTATTHFSTGGAETGTLADGTAGQFKSFAMKGDGGNMVITVASAGWKDGASGTITFDDMGDSCLLQFIEDRWYAVGSTGVAFA